MKTKSNVVQREIIIAILATILLVLGSCGAQGALTTKEIEKLKLPGRKVNMQCVKFAYCLNYILFSKGVESKLVVIDYGRATKYFTKDGKPVGHAIVLFRLDGQWYGFDNEVKKPIPVSGSTDLEMAISFDPDTNKLRDPNKAYGSADVAKFVKELGGLK